MKDLNGHPYLQFLTIGLLIATLITALLSMPIMLTVMPMQAVISFIVWMGLAIISAYWMRREFVPAYLISLFSMMIAWRLAGLFDLDRISFPLCGAFIVYIANFIYCAVINLRYPSTFKHAIPLEEWQLIFIRLYLGLNFIPHFTEKLFAGPGPRLLDVNAFTQLGVPAPEFFVVLAGLCEFGAAIAIGLGFMMRLGALGAVLYLMIATYLGHHFSLGFIWAGPGGGWEYAVMWVILIISFAIVGKHNFTIDQYLEDHYHLPSFIKKWM